MSGRSNGSTPLAGGVSTGGPGRARVDKKGTTLRGVASLAFLPLAAQDLLVLAVGRDGKALSRLLACFPTYSLALVEEWLRRVARVLAGRLVAEEARQLRQAIRREITVREEGPGRAVRPGASARSKVGPTSRPSGADRAATGLLKPTRTDGA